MMYVDFEGTNITLTKPEGWTDEQCSDLKAQQGANENGHGYYLIAFKPSFEDLQAMDARRPVFIRFLNNNDALFIRLTAFKGRWGGYLSIPGVTAWLPTVDERRILSNGGNLWVEILSNSFPPIQIFTTDENNNPN